jgi:hypothetical protein
MPQCKQNQNSCLCVQWNGTLHLKPSNCYNLWAPLFPGIPLSPWFLEDHSYGIFQINQLPAISSSVQIVALFFSCFCVRYYHFLSVPQ